MLPLHLVPVFALLPDMCASACKLIYGVSVKKDLYTWQNRPTHGKRDLFMIKKRPMHTRAYLRPQRMRAPVNRLWNLEIARCALWSKMRKSATRSQAARDKLPSWSKSSRDMALATCKLGSPMSCSRRRVSLASRVPELLRSR